MIPVIAIVGRPNVGKSTLFNRVTKSRDAIVANQSGLTRDRQYGEGFFADKKFIVIDTGGIGDEEHELDHLMASQSKQAIVESDVVLFMVDARAGLTAADEMVADRLRSLNKKVFLVLNKIDGVDVDVASAEFHGLGFGKIMPIAASHGRGINILLKEVLATFAEKQEDQFEDIEQGIKVAIIGRPNVGKSSLVNRILGEERVTVFDQPGTTRDSIFIPFERRGVNYTIIDTAGVRRRGKLKEKVEKFSVIKALQAIEKCHVVVCMVDAREGIVEQDLRLLGFVLDSGKALLIAVNKWDGLEEDERVAIKRELDRRLVFVEYAKLHFISALHGSGVGNLFESIGKAYSSAMKKISTPQATKMLEHAVATHQPPLVRGRRIKLRYAHVGGHNPPIIVIHGTQVKSLPLSYKRYLENFFRDKLKLVGTPIRIELREGKNPYK
jgi:GTPase